MPDQLVTRLLPVLAKRTEDEFNIFNVMHHGTHEKQISNVFAWLLDANGTHKLGYTFQRIFVDEVNDGRRDGEPPIPYDEYSVRQEVNTSDPDKADIADMVLEGGKTGTVLVVENYYISCGHGHSYEGYRTYGDRMGKSINFDGKGVVVMLCESEDCDELKDGWKEAAVVTYANLVEKLFNRIESDDDYRRRYPDRYTFFCHMHKRFAKGRRMGDDDLIKFVGAMCASGEAGRFGFKRPEEAKSDFGEELKEQAMARFAESRGLLQRVKERLKNDAQVLSQVNAALGSGVAEVKTNYAGIYQWTVGFTVVGESAPGFQLKFGPSAWYANEKDENWTRTVSASAADYSCLFLTRVRTKEVRQSAVTLLEVLDGLSKDDFRLREEIVRLIRESN